MPYLSDAELQSQLSRVARTDDSDSRSDAGPTSIVPVLGGMGTAAAMGFLRAKFEDPVTGQWNIPGTQWDAEAVAFLALLGVAFGGSYIGLGEFRGYAALGAVGVGCHFAGEVARNYGKTGKLDFHVGAGVPPWDPTSFDPTQFAAPYDDDAARGLASSGV